MKLLLISISVLSAFTLFLFCKQTKYSVGNMPPRQLRWGGGGGFVGKETVYTLLENGQLFVQDGVGAPLQELNQIKAKAAKSLYKTAAALGIAKTDFMHPGNTYDFIEMQEGEGARRVVWGAAGYDVNPTIKDLFNQLNKLIVKK